jgi:multidrug resistance efflux pump
MATNKETSVFEKDFTPKIENRKIRKPIVIVVAIVILLAGLGFAGYSIYDGSFYYQTDNAKVDTIIYQLTANANGQLVKMAVSEGDEVKAGQVLAQVEKGPYVRSPVDGTVTDVRMQLGNYVNASNVILVVAETSDMYITANVEETNILEIQPGQSVSVSLDAYGQSFDGYVAAVNTVASTKLAGSATSFTTSGTYTKVTQLIPIKIKLPDNVDLADIIGTNATVKIRIK